MAAQPRVTPVILAGGSGTRLWPVSRRNFPKQFVPFSGEHTLFQQAALRFAPSDSQLFAPPVVVTADAFRFVVGEQLAGVGLSPTAILVEPMPRNTAPAVVAAALHLCAEDPDTLMLIAPSDHAIADAAAFHAAILRGMSAAESGQIVTFGICPDRPETGYGYLQLAHSPGAGGGPVPLAGFIEKPDAATAAALLAGGRHLWNAGLFMARADTFVAAFAAHAPECLNAVRAALLRGRADLGFLRLDADSFAAAPAISVDYAVMEHARNLVAVPFDGGWSDLGDWDAVWRAAGRGSTDGVVKRGPVTQIDCQNSLLHASDAGQVLVGIGLQDMIAVATPDAILVAPKARAQDVRRAVEVLKFTEAPQAETPRRMARPWGAAEVLTAGPGFRVNRLHINPRSALSLQSHQHRAEHWVVVAGSARVTLDGEQRSLIPNQSAYVPPHMLHRIENITTEPLEVIEVQSGSLIDDADVMRFEDPYARHVG
nr:mannose-1-phosphate guanylyltransferase/mannose-6-phosphate isomerase [Ketogulonicigenium robustum]